MYKPRLLIVIDNLKKGGAEVLLINILPDLRKKFFIILVTITDETEFPKDDISYDRRYILGSGKKVSVIKNIIKLRKICIVENPSVVHSHLFWSSLIARISCPSGVPLIFSLHNEMSRNVFNNSKILTFLEKFTLRKRHWILAVSQSVLDDYQKIICKHSNSVVLKNFIGNEYFDDKNKRVRVSPQGLSSLKIVAVGNIKNQKNYYYLVQAFRHLKTKNISLEIFGSGKENEIQALANEITADGLKIRIMGQIDHPYKIFSNYDLFVSSSSYEGFGLAPIEAMASGLPLLLSDIPVYHEVTEENALFFKTNDIFSFVNLIDEILKNQHSLHDLSEQGVCIATQYNKSCYLSNLFKIYDELLGVS